MYAVEPYPSVDSSFVLAVHRSGGQCGKTATLGLQIGRGRIIQRYRFGWQASTSIAACSSRSLTACWEALRTPRICCRRPLSVGSKLPMTISDRRAHSGDGLLALEQLITFAALATSYLTRPADRRFFLSTNTSLDHDFDRVGIGRGASIRRNAR